jgi:hypothetical protein
MGDRLQLIKALMLPAFDLNAATGLSIIERQAKSM